MAPPVVLLHGFATSARRTWIETGWTDLLSEAGRTVMALDLLGHGEAPKPHDARAYDDVEGLVLSQLPEEPVDVVGYSAGARIALVLASRNPERFNRLVVAGIGGSLFQPRTSNPIYDALDGKADPDDRIGAHFLAMASSAGNDPEALKAFIGRTQPRLDTDDLALIKAPTLVILGDKDFAGPGEPLAAALPVSTLVTLKGIDHFGLPKSFDFVERGLDHLGAAPF